MKPASRLPTKDQEVAAVLRREVLTGYYPAKAKLPVQTELSRRFGVGGGTIQRALNQLVQDGFLHARRRHGTFVVDKLPHLQNYALIFYGAPTEVSASRYYVALMNVAMEIQRQQDARIQMFYGIDRHVDTEDYQRLLHDLRSQRLAGMIFANAPHALVDSPLLEETEIPRVAFMGSTSLPHVLAVGLDGERFMERALQRLADQGRRRIAILSTADDTQAETARFQSLLARHGMRSPTHWRLPISPLAPQGAMKCVQLLLQGDPGQAPDGLIVTDDNLADHAIAGLVAVGARVPEQIAVVLHCNFPWPPVTVLPVQRLGYDIRRALRTCLQLIDRQRQGQPGDRLTLIPPIFEEELGAA